MMGRENSMCDRDEEYVTKFKCKKTVKNKHIGRPRHSVKDNIKVHLP
jgi:hypothetical protein